MIIEALVAQATPSPGAGYPGGGHKGEIALLLLALIAACLALIVYLLWRSQHRRHQRRRGVDDEPWPAPPAPPNQ
jgi:hypothetical protein